MEFDEEGLSFEAELGRQDTDNRSDAPGTTFMTTLENTVSNLSRGNGNGMGMGQSDRDLLRSDIMREVDAARGGIALTEKMRRDVRAEVEADLRRDFELKMTQKSIEYELKWEEERARMAQKERKFREGYEAEIDELRRRLTSAECVDHFDEKDGDGLTDALSAELERLTNVDFELEVESAQSEADAETEEVQSLLRAEQSLARRSSQVNMAEKAEEGVPDGDAPCYSCFGLFKGHARG